MAAIVAIRIDLAKNVFVVHGVDATGEPVLVCPSAARAKLVDSLPPCPIGMQGCSGARHCEH